MATKIDIVNLAIVPLGAEPISDLSNPENTMARKANSVYPRIRRATLRKHFWNFAMKEQQLAKVSATPVLDDYTDIFQLPADFIRMKATDLDEVNGETYKIKGRRIYCNASTLRIEYVADIDDPNQYDDEFIEALAAALRDALAFAVTDNATLAAAVKGEAKEKLRQAKSTDSQEESIDKPRRGSWIRGR